MKKFLILFISLFILTIPCLAKDNNDDEGLGSMSDYLGGKGSVFDDPFGGQKQYSDEAFQKALEEKKSHMKKYKKKKVRGKANEDNDAADKIDETAEKTIILMLPNNIINGDGTYIPAGHYKIVGVEGDDENDDYKVYLDFYQAHTKVARVPAIKTKYDFDEQNINFAKVVPYDEHKIKVIFGSLDFNAWTLLRVVN